MKQINQSSVDDVKRNKRKERERESRGKSIRIFVHMYRSCFDDTTIVESHANRNY